VRAYCWLSLQTLKVTLDYANLSLAMSVPDILSDTSNSNIFLAHV
jgi:hypothetical protein